jgi:hypothetical protein
MNVLRTCDVVLLLMILGIRPGKGGVGEPFAPREAEKHQDGGDEWWKQAKQNQTDRGTEGAHGG